MKANIGDMVWIAQLRWTERRMTCPVCQGKLHLCVHPVGLTFDLYGEIVPCTYCRGARELDVDMEGWTLGTVSESWGNELTVRQVKIEGKKEIPGHETEYYYDVVTNGHCVLRPDDIFATEAEARAEGDRKVRESDEAQDKHRLEQAKGHKQQIGWDRGYHKAEIKALEEKIKWHKGKLGIT